MLDVKKVLSKILNWSGLKFTWDANTNNTNDTWILVTKDYKTVQHRVLPTDSQVNATKVGSLWTAGNITAHRKGNCCICKIDGATIQKVTSRTVIATLPSGYRPLTEVTYQVSIGNTAHGIWGIRNSGEIWVENNTVAGAKYTHITYPV